MKKYFYSEKMTHLILLILTMVTLMVLPGSCRKDDSDIDINGPLLGNPENTGVYLFFYTKDDNGYYRTVNAGGSFGDQICEGSGLDKWYYVTGVQSGVNQFIAFHAKHHWDASHGKEFSLRRIMPGGYVGEETQSQTWNNNYETFFGYQIGGRGYIFGQDSDDNHHWFIQEVNSNGTLADNLSSQGYWNNYYRYATPLYINGQTYFFFQDENKYWFITHVSQDGSMNDICDGTWGSYWDVLTSVEIENNTYLIGERSNSSPIEWFIQKINSDGSMGIETDRSTWNNFYSNQVAYTIGDQAYLFGSQGTGTTEFLYYFQKITPDGKMGVETSHGSMQRFDAAIAFELYENPGSFRYSVGWDLSKSNGKPSSWSSRYDDPWGGYVKFGGGAALADIDADAGQKLDAVLVGIQDQQGPDRFYYKVAWNLDVTGKAASMTGTLFGPTIGEGQAGAGADITDLDSNGIPDLILMVVDDPQESNSFWYYIGWNLNPQGVVTAWSNKVQGPGLGSFDQGGGTAIGDIDKNGRPDMVFMAIDDPQDDNSIWMVVARNLESDGIPASWSDRTYPSCDVGWLSSGGGAALADINNNGKLDLVLLDIDSPKGPDALWYWVGWDIDINGNVTGWSPKYVAPSTGSITYGAGAAVGDINKNGTPDVLFVAIDNPYGVDGAQ